MTCYENLQVLGNSLTVRAFGRICVWQLFSYNWGSTILIPGLNRVTNVQWAKIWKSAFLGNYVFAQKPKINLFVAFGSIHIRISHCTILERFRALWIFVVEAWSAISKIEILVWGSTFLRKWRKWTQMNANGICAKTCPVFTQIGWKWKIQMSFA